MDKHRSKNRRMEPGQRMAVMSHLTVLEAQMLDDYAHHAGLSRSRAISLLLDVALFKASAIADRAKDFPHD